MKTHSNDKFVVDGYHSISSLVATMNSKAEVFENNEKFNVWENYEKFNCPGTRNQQSSPKVPNSMGPNLIQTYIHQMEKQSDWTGLQTFTLFFSLVFN